jgi:hypothetical protein
LYSQQNLDSSGVGVNLKTVDLDTLSKKSLPHCLLQLEWLQPLQVFIPILKLNLYRLESRRWKIVIVFKLQHNSITVWPSVVRTNHIIPCHLFIFFALFLYKCENTKFEFNLSWMRKSENCYFLFCIDRRVFGESLEVLSQIERRPIPTVLDNLFSIIESYENCALMI